MPGIFSIFYSAVLSVHGVMVLCPLSRYIGFGEKMKAGVVEREREREREFMRARTEAPRGCVRVKGRASKRACEQTRESNICLIIGSLQEQEETPLPTSTTWQLPYSSARCKSIA